MRERQPLKQNTELRFTNHVGGNMKFVVGEVIGIGGSCIVYDGYYVNNSGTRNTVRIKECFPYKLHIKRNDVGKLIVPPNEIEKFEKCKDTIRQSFSIANELHELNGLTNLTTNVYDIYEANNTVYIVASYVEGSTLSDVDFVTLKDAVKVVLSTAKSIEKIHNDGYLYLDVKPDNILMYNETPELIQLFDYDSVIPIAEKENITEYRVSYSVGFAPLEQKTGKMCHIGKRTDVYSIGALLFYLLFGKAPGTADCGFGVTYDYTKLKWDTMYQQRLYNELNVFFNNTLQPYYMDRYEDMSGVVAQLQEIVKYADMPVPFICSCYVANTGLVVGREKECASLAKWYNSDEKIIFVTGMGGIGKSTIVRKFASDNADSFDSIIYVQYRNSICETIADDTQFCINGYEKDANESIKEYFDRKIKAARELTVNTNTLFVIDNFDGVIDESFKELVNVNWRIIAVTRCNMENSGYACQKIESLNEKEKIYSLFESSLGRKIKFDEYRKLDRLIEMVSGHTLTLVLIARQIAKSYLELDEVLTLAEEKGFSVMSPEKVDYMHDGKMFYDKMTGIIKAIFDISGLSEDKKKCLKILSLFDSTGVNVREVKGLLKLDSLDDVNELRDLGWIEINDKVVQMHPLIQETIYQMEWTDECRHIAIYEMEHLRDTIKLNGSKGKEPDYHKLCKYLYRAKAFLFSCGKDDCLSLDNVYKSLMYITIVNSPKEQENYILSNAERLFSDSEGMSNYEIIELYDYIVYILCQKESFKHAKKYLRDAKTFAKKCNSHYIWGLYYDMLGDYYDSLQNGKYSPGNEAEILGLRKLYNSMDKAVYHMKQEKSDKAKILCCKYVLGMACGMIRSTPEKKNEIKRLISGIKPTIQHYSSVNSYIRSVYYMVCAWYYTLCEPNNNAVVHYLYKASDINEVRGMSELDYIDYYYIPAANMMVELGEIARSLEYLEEAIHICDNHMDIAPYTRKKGDLLGYKSQVEKYK